MSIYKLHEQRELVAETLIVLLPHELFLESGHQRIERHTLIFTLGNYRLVALNTGYFPALAHILNVAVEMFERQNSVASPNGLFKYCFEF